MGEAPASSSDVLACHTRVLGVGGTTNVVKGKSEPQTLSSNVYTLLRDNTADQANRPMNHAMRPFPDIDVTPSIAS